MDKFVESQNTSTARSVTNGTDRDDFVNIEHCFPRHATLFKSRTELGIAFVAGVARLPGILLQTLKALFEKFAPRHIKQIDAGGSKNGLVRQLGLNFSRCSFLIPLNLLVRSVASSIRLAGHGEFLNNRHNAVVVVRELSRHDLKVRRKE